MCIIVLVLTAIGTYLKICRKDNSLVQFWIGMSCFKTFLVINKIFVILYEKYNKKIDKSLLLIFILLIIIYLIHNINKNISISGFSVGASVAGVCAISTYNPTNNQNKKFVVILVFTRFCHRT